MSAEPQVTFLMSTWNGTRFLEPAIRSMLDQTHRDWRGLIVDDCSTDGTADLAEELADERIEVVRLAENGGQTAALNHGLTLVKTPWVARLDQDDVAGARRLELQLALVARLADPVLVGTWADFIDAGSRKIGSFRPSSEPQEVLRDLYYRPLPIAHSGAMYRTDIALELGGYPADLSYAQDYALWIAMARRGQVANVPEVLTYLRDHDNRAASAEASSSVRQMDEALGLLDKLVGEWDLPPGEAARARRGRARFLTQRALAHRKAGNAASARADGLDVARAALRNPGVMNDVGETVRQALVVRARAARDRVRG